MSRSILAAAATIAVVAAMPQTPATAQQPDIIVAAPRVHNPDEPNYSARKLTRLASTMWVSTADLNLRTRYGRYVLDQRMRYAANATCDQLDAISPLIGIGAMSNPDPQDCRYRAYKRGRESARYLIWAAG